MEKYVRDYLEEEKEKVLEEYSKKIEEVSNNGIWVYRYLVKYG